MTMERDSLVAVDVVDMITKDGPHEKKPCSRCASAWAAIECAEAAPAEAAGETERATRYAENLAIVLHNKHYATDAPNWRPLSGDLAGLLTQIDNMTAGMTRTPSDTAPSPKGVSDGVRAALVDLVSWFDGGPSSYGPWIIKAGPYGADAAVEAARAALSQEPVPATAEERAASKEGA